jgi:hypothetical protein
MCNGFGLIVDSDLTLHFIEPDGNGDVSHSKILERLGWQENTDPFTRRFVRVEYPDWTFESFRFDENETLPGWAEENRTEIIEKCNKALASCAPAWAEYKKVCDAARAEYDKVCDAAWAEYDKVCAPAWAEYKKVCDAARAEYDKVCDAAWAEYKKVRAPAWAEMIAKFERIAGYVKA